MSITTVKTPRGKSIKDLNTHAANLATIASDQDDMFVDHKPLYDAAYADGLRVGHFFEPTVDNLTAGKSCASKSSWAAIQESALSIFDDKDRDLHTMKKVDFIEKYEISDAEWKSFFYPRKRGEIKNRYRNVFNCWISAMKTREPKSQNTPESADLVAKHNNYVSWFAENAPVTEVHKQVAVHLQSASNLLTEYYAGVADEKKSA